MAASSTTTINLSSTSLPGHTGATTPTTFTDTMNSAATVVAILTAGHTTITAYQIESTTGLAVVDGTTLTWRHNKGITLPNGEVVSLGFNGLEDSTTTAMYQAVTLSSSATVPTSRTVVVTKSSTTLTKTKGVHHHHTSAGSPTTKKTSTGTAGAASTSSSGVAPTMGAGKALALLGALGGMVAYGL